MTAIEKGNTVANEYVAKNLSSNKDTIINSWTKSEVDSEEGLYTKDNNLYYVVKLKEEVRHFFLSGWFDDMTAPVTAVALLSKTAIKGDSQSSDHKMPDTPTPPLVDDLIENVVLDEELIKEIETVKNENVIVGNWEVQSYYSSLNKDSTDTYIDYSQNPNGEVKYYKRGESFKQRYTFDVYTQRWNQYQDRQNRYNTGDHRRTETVNIIPNNTGKNTTDTKVSNSYATSANGNKVYSEEEVDSLNIDFKQDVRFKTGSKYLSQDWDFSMNDYSKTNYDDVESLLNTNGYNKSSSAIYMRIHNTMNFNLPHLTRSSSTEDPDILWVRIESEPMLTNADSPNGEVNSNVKNSGIREFNSVRQIILNFNKANTEKDSDGKDKYRPVVIFYDEPERYSTSNDIRDSEPVIVNLNDDFQGVLYAPNSPVVLNGNNKKFTGFIVAKKYLKLKTEEDFPVKEGEIYYTDAANKTNEYFKITDDYGNTMFIDAHGEVQYDELDSPMTKYGTYSNFNRTAFTTHGYKVLKSSANNMLLSGN